MKDVRWYVIAVVLAVFGSASGIILEEKWTKGDFAEVKELHLVAGQPQSIKIPDPSNPTDPWATFKFTYTRPTDNMAELQVEEGGAITPLAADEIPRDFGLSSNGPGGRLRVKYSFWVEGDVLVLRFKAWYPWRDEAPRPRRA